MADEEDGSAKAHRKRQAGPKAEKKKKKEGHKEKNDAERNPRAFTFRSSVRAARQFHRKQDIETKRHHVPEVDRTPLEPPPVVVGVVGPPKVGKTTLINSLLKNFTRQNLSDIKGPVTVVSGKKRRLTFLECNNDINSMIDTAKIADLVLVLIDASFGFEMEVFEFLNICQVHGFPKIMGVLTHLDLLKNNKSLKKTKKKLKHRFWTEVYQGAKLFNLSGMSHGCYPKTEIHNLGRFISVMKFRPLQWRAAHPYVLVDRMEDLTDQEMLRQDIKCDRIVSLYGYVRGTHLKACSHLHLVGCGEYKMKDISLLPDPCPLPDKQKKRTLNERERSLYAPMSGVGGILYDKDAVYIDLGGSHAHTERLQLDNTEQKKPGNDLVSTLMDTKHTIDSKMATSHLTVFKGSKPIAPDIFDEHFEGAFPRDEVIQQNSQRNRRRVIFDNDEENDNELKEEEADDEDEQDETIHRERNKDDEHVETDDDESDDYGDESGSEEEDNKADELIQKDIEQCEDEEVTFNRRHHRKGFKRKHLGDDTNSPSERNPRAVSEGKPANSEMEELQTPSGRILDKNTQINDSANILPKGKKLKSELSQGTDIFLKRKSTKKELLSQREKQYEDFTSRKTGCKDGKHSINSKTKDSVEDNDGSKIGYESETGDGSDFSFEDDDDSGVDDSDNESLEVDDVDDDNESLDVEDVDDGDNESLDVDDVDDSDNNSLEVDDVDDGGESVLDDDHSGMESDVDKSGNEDHQENDVSTNDQSKPVTVEEGHLKWKDNIAQKAAQAFYARQQATPNLRKLVYGNVSGIRGKESLADSSESDDEDTLGGIFKIKTKKKRSEDDLVDGRDCSLNHFALRKDWALDDLLDSIRDCFVTGKWKDSEDAEKLLEGDEDDELYGDFEDLETGEMRKTGNEEEEQDSDLESGGEKEDNEITAQEKRLEKKKKLKAAFNANYDEGDDGTHFDDLKAQMNEQAQLNQAEFEDMDDEMRVQYEGYRPGMYVRIELSGMPAEFVNNFDPRYPVILGGLLSNEHSIGFVQSRFKKHRWHKKILKTRDPLILSVGWRRFQSLPLYSVQDHNGRHRLLKYTPEHMHCMATFYGPLAAPGTGVLAVQSVSGTTADFRISATGTILDLDKSTTVVKKLKLTGTPIKIFKNTAFIKSMFNSALEVAKFEGATIRTVSGVRGQVKRALKSPEGAFRATFEDKILMSDIVFLRTWYPVNIPSYYNPVTSLLLPLGNKTEWLGMRTVGQLRKETGIAAPNKEDSHYKPILRETRRFNPLKLSKALQKDLPFKSKPKLMRKRKAPTLETRRAVVMEPHEKKAYTLMQQLYTFSKEKQRKRKEKMVEKRKLFQENKATQDKKREARQKAERKRIFRLLSKEDKKKQKTRH